MSPNAPRPHTTQKDLARALGLSQASISKALRNDPEIEKSTRQRVLAAAKAMGYHPNPMAAGLAHFRAGSKVKPVHAALAWLNTWTPPEQLRSYYEFDLYWQGASRAAEKFGYRLEEFRINKQLTAHRLQKILLTREIRGLLIPPIPCNDKVDWSRFAWEQFATVRFGRRPRGLPSLNLVTSAQFYNATLAVTRMNEKGYQRIAYVGYRTNIWNFLGGFIQAQLTSIPEESRIPPMLFDEKVTDQTWNGLKPTDELFTSFRAWLKKWKPDAILTEVPATALLLNLAGLEVPKDIAVAGLSVGNLPFDAGIYQNPEEVGRVAVLVVVSLMQDNALGVPSVAREVLVKGTWVDGASLPPR